MCQMGGRASVRGNSEPQAKALFSHSDWRGPASNSGFPFRRKRDSRGASAPQAADEPERKLFRHKERMTDNDGDGIFGGDLGFDSDAEKEKEEVREKRTRQTEEDFQRQKREWTPKVETREVLPTIVWS